MSDKESKLGRPKASHAKRRKMQEAYIDQEAAQGPREFKAFNMKMDPDLHSRLRTSAFKQDRTMTEITQELIRDYLDERKE